MSVPDFREEAQELFDKHCERMQELTLVWNDRVNVLVEQMRDVIEIFDEMQEVHDKMLVLGDKWNGGNV